jgi:hypothetical protein
MPAVSPHVARWAISPFDIAEHFLSEPGFCAMSHNGAARWRRPDRVLRSPPPGAVQGRDVQSGHHQQQTDIRPAALV